jgi:hypothetical protein
MPTREGLARPAVLAIAVIALAVPASTGAGVPPQGELNLVHEGTTTSFSSPPSQESESSYHDCTFFAGQAPLLAGGFFFQNAPFDEVQANSSYPYDSTDVDSAIDSWNVVLENNTSDTNIQLGETEVCGDVDGVNYQHHREPSPAGSRVTVKAGCPEGEHVLGGGGEEDGPFASQRLVETAPFDSGDAGTRPDDGWRITVDNVGAASYHAKAWAICAPLNGLGYNSTWVTAAGKQRTTGKAKCGQRFLVGGGSSNNGSFGRQTLVGSSVNPGDLSKPIWVARLDNRANKFVGLRIFAICHR